MKPQNSKPTPAKSTGFTREPRRTTGENVGEASAENDIRFERDIQMCGGDRDTYHAIYGDYGDYPAMD